jgi:OmpA-OmpF porin, OOP family
MKKIFLVVTLLCSIFTLQAQEKLNKQYAKRPALGVHFSLTDFKTAGLIRSQSLSTVLINKQWQPVRSMSPGLGLSYTKGFSNHIDMQARLNASFLNLPNARFSSLGDNFFGEFDITANAKMLSDKYWVTPFLTAGIGAANYDGTYFSAYMPLGGGVQLNFWDEAFLVINSQYRVPITASNDYHFYHSIGILGNIGAPKNVVAPVVVTPPVVDKDTDGDGIMDSKDKCITVKGTSKYDGCPIPDTDGDGINDEDDKCKTEKGVIRFQGCPIPDTDGDGINDEEDKCINQRGVARYQGCPIPDTDNDGVNDEEDKCVDVAGVVENQGCPAIEEKVIEKIEFAAKNILFETGSAKLKSSSFKNLNEVAKILVENNSLQLDIEGHTDNTGNAEKNQTLSESRAKAVLDYLVKKGIEESRLTSAGFGQDQPIADNATPAGRTKNRRVELKLRSF